MMSLFIHICSVTVIFNIRIVTPNSTEKNEQTTTEDAKAIEMETIQLNITTEPSTTPSLNLYDWDLYCKLQPNGFDCANDGIGKTRYYYDVKLEECTKFVYGGCGGNQRNIFLTAKECSQACKEPGNQPLDSYWPNVFCRLQPEFGTCSDYIPMFYFDVTHRKCVGFSYSGCAGNQNRFSSQNVCHQVCGDAADAYGKPEETEIIKYRL